MPARSRPLPAELLDEVEVLDAAQPGIGDRDAPEAHAPERHHRAAGCETQLQAGRHFERLAAEKRQIGIEWNQEPGTGQAVGKVNSRSAAWEMAVSLKAGLPGSDAVLAPGAPTRGLPAAAIIDSNAGRFVVGE
ncbi:MAG: hypothetical protein WAK95_16405 [Desulfobacterales bacterium]